MALITEYGRAFKDKTSAPSRPDWAMKHAPTTFSGALKRDTRITRKAEWNPELLQAARQLGVAPKYLESILLGYKKPSEAFLRHIGEARDIGVMVESLRAKLCS